MERRTVHREKYKMKAETTKEDYDLFHLQSLLPFIKNIPDNRKLCCRNHLQSVVKFFVEGEIPCAESLPDKCQTSSKESNQNEARRRLTLCQPCDPPEPSQATPKCNIPRQNGCRQSSSQQKPRLNENNKQDTCFNQRQSKNKSMKSVPNKYSSNKRETRCPDQDKSINSRSTPNEGDTDSNYPSPEQLLPSEPTAPNEGDSNQQKSQPSLENMPLPRGQTPSEKPSQSVPQQSGDANQCPPSAPPPKDIAPSPPDDVDDGNGYDSDDSETGDEYDDDDSEYETDNALTNVKVCFKKKRHFSNFKNSLHNKHNFLSFSDVHDQHACLPSSQYCSTNYHVHAPIWSPDNRSWWY